MRERERESRGFMSTDHGGWSLSLLRPWCRSGFEREKRFESGLREKEKNKEKPFRHGEWLLRALLAHGGFRKERKSEWGKSIESHGWNFGGLSLSREIRPDGENEKKN